LNKAKKTKFGTKLLLSYFLRFFQSLRHFKQRFSTFHQIFCSSFTSKRFVEQTIEMTSFAGSDSNDCTIDTQWSQLHASVSTATMQNFPPNVKYINHTNRLLTSTAFQNWLMCTCLLFLEFWW